MMISRCAKWTAMALLCSILIRPAGAEDSKAMESGRRSCRALGTAPWYDSSDDTIRRIDVTSDEDDVNRHSKWARESSPPSEKSQVSSLTVLLVRMMQILAWIFLGVLLVALMWLLVWAALRFQAASAESESEKVSEAEVDASRMESLPIPLGQSDQDLLALARSFRDAGEYGKAVIYAFAHQLVELDKHQLIHLSKGKTNRQYLQELKAKPQIAAMIRRTMLAFEDVFFGSQQLTPQRFQWCWDGLDEFHRHLEQTTA